MNLLKSKITNNEYGAIIYGSLTSATFKNCIFHDNNEDGICASGSTMHLHGETTAMHSNRRHGIWAHRSGKVFIHLPSNHNTSYNNGSEDRRARNGATITNVCTRS